MRGVAEGSQHAGDVPQRRLLLALRGRRPRRDGPRRSGCRRRPRPAAPVPAGSRRECGSSCRRRRVPRRFELRRRASPRAASSVRTRAAAPRAALSTPDAAPTRARAGALGVRQRAPAGAPARSSPAKRLRRERGIVESVASATCISAVRRPSARRDLQIRAHQVAFGAGGTSPRPERSPAGVERRPLARRDLIEEAARATPSRASSRRPGFRPPAGSSRRCRAVPARV